MMALPQTPVGQALAQAPVLAILRYPRADGLGLAIQALAAGGIRVAEITATTPGWLDAIAAAADSGLVIGGGTVTTVNQVRDVAAAGGQFTVSPGLDFDVVAESRRLDLEPLPGIFTGTEIMLAARLGVELLKLFPAGAAGVDYLRQLRGPFPDLAFVPTGGIAPATVESWLSAGAAAVALGSELAGRTGPSTPRDAEALTGNARTALAAVGSAG
jgi:2-dehydro-3-deoxyphosphogluconate aldolase/(4S)-4-hydroxy-2-oxoglutarate aldolase